MKKEKGIVAITIGIICIILAFVMTVQLRTVKETDITLIENMREDVLKEQAEVWKQKYEETQSKIDEDNKKINEYKEKTTNKEETAELLNTELSQARTTLGTTDVEGEGIIINLKDGDESVVAEDLLKLVNELKLAGAEAISINNERIINLTEIVDVNSYIIINGNRTSNPYEIKAIGNEQYLMSGLSAKGGFSDSIKNKGKSISITQEKNVKISKYNKEINLKTIKIN